MRLLIQYCAEVDCHDNQRGRSQVLDDRDEVGFGDVRLDLTPADGLCGQLC